MAILHVRNVPDELYERLRERAASQKRSLGAEVVLLLESAVTREAGTEGDLFERLRQRREALARRDGPFPPSVDLLREDRAR